MSAEPVSQNGLKLESAGAPDKNGAAPKQQNYKGFLAGVFSGITKLAGKLPTKSQAEDKTLTSRAQSATPSTRSKSAFKHRSHPSSTGPYNASCKRSATRASPASIRAPHPH